MMRKLLSQSPQRARTLERSRPKNTRLDELVHGYVVERNPRRRLIDVNQVDHLNQLTFLLERKHKSCNMLRNREGDHHFSL